MKTYENSGQEVGCPFCESTDDCPHLIGTIDRTFGEFSGFLRDEWAFFTTDLEKLMHLALVNGVKEFSDDVPFWLNLSLNQVRDETPNEPELGDIDISNDSTMELFMELLSECGIYESDSDNVVDEEEGPMAASSYTVYYSPSPSDDMKEFKKYRQEFISKAKNQISN